MQRLLGYPNQTCILYHDYHVQKSYLSWSKENGVPRSRSPKPVLLKWPTASGKQPQAFFQRGVIIGALLYFVGHTLADSSVCQPVSTRPVEEDGHMAIMAGIEEDGRNTPWQSEVIFQQSVLIGFVWLPPFLLENPKDTISFLFTFSTTAWLCWLLFFKTLRKGLDFLQPYVDYPLTTDHFARSQNWKMGFLEGEALLGTPPYWYPHTYPAEANGVLCPATTETPSERFNVAWLTPSQVWKTGWGEQSIRINSDFQWFPYVFLCEKKGRSAPLGMIFGP